MVCDKDQVAWSTSDRKLEDSAHNLLLQGTKPSTRGGTPLFLEMRNSEASLSWAVEVPEVEHIQHVLGGGQLHGSLLHLVPGRVDHSDSFFKSR